METRSPSSGVYFRRHSRSQSRLIGSDLLVDFTLPEQQLLWFLHPIGECETTKLFQRFKIAAGASDVAWQVDTTERSSNRKNFQHSLQGRGKVAVMEEAGTFE